MQSNFNKLKSIFFLLLVAVLVASCAQSTNQQVSNAATPEVKLTEIERHIKAMRTAEFEFVFVLKKKDGGELNAADKAFAKASSPTDTNRFVLTDDGKTVIAGSSYKFEDENIKKLSERFVIENHSAPIPPKENLDGESNVNNS